MYNMYKLSFWFFFFAHYFCFACVEKLTVVPYTVTLSCTYAQFLKTFYIIVSLKGLLLSVYFFFFKVKYVL